MTTSVVVTGAGGFIGRHVCVELERWPTVAPLPIRHETGSVELPGALDRADVVIHLAGVNRPTDAEDFVRVNVQLTRTICDRLLTRGASVPVILSSSTQAGNGTPYGESKLGAERVVENYAANGGRGILFRFPNVFGKWCRPRYNSAVATFASAIARGEPYQVHDAKQPITLLHVADAVAAIRRSLSELPAAGVCDRREATPTRTIRVGELVRMLEEFASHRRTLRLPDFADPFVRAMYSTYLSYLPPEAFGYDLARHEDQRGALAEFLKSAHFGQIFVSRTKPGVTRGRHWHETKVEKFLVVAGDAVIRFRAVGESDVVVFRVSDQNLQVVDIPPGYVHSIENVGHDDLVTLFWADEVFDPTHPDTWAADVNHG